MDDRLRTNPAQDLFEFWDFLKSYDHQGNASVEALAEFFEDASPAHLYARTMETAAMPEQIRHILSTAIGEDRASAHCDWWVAEEDSFFLHFQLASTVESAVSMLDENVLRQVYSCSSLIDVYSASDPTARSLLEKLSALRSEIDADTSVDPSLKMELIEGIQRLEHVVLAHFQQSGNVVVVPAWTAACIVLHEIHAENEEASYLSDLVALAQEIGQALAESVPMLAPVAEKLLSP